MGPLAARPGVLEDVHGIDQHEDVATRLLPQASTQSEKDAVTLLYHLAVAAAFVCHREEISTQPLDVRRSIYKELAGTLSGPTSEISRQASR